MTDPTHGTLHLSSDHASAVLGILETRRLIGRQGNLAWRTHLQEGSRTRRRPSFSRAGGHGDGR
jgi:hypothetical protein